MFQRRNLTLFQLIHEADIPCYQSIEDDVSVRPPPSAPCLAQKNSYIKPINPLYIDKLKQEFYKVTAETKGLQKALNTLIQPIIHSMSAVKIDSATQKISNIEFFNELYNQQNTIFEHEFKPFLSKKAASKVSEALNIFETNVSKKLSDISTIGKKSTYSSMIETDERDQSFESYVAPLPSAPVIEEYKRPAINKNHLKFIEGIFIATLRDEIYECTVKAKRLQHSLNTLFEPILLYIDDLSVDCITYQISGITDESYSFNGLLALLQKQKDIFKKEFKPFLSDGINLQVEASFTKINDFIFKNLKESGASEQKYYQDISRTRKIVCKARLRQCLDVLGMLVCIGWCPLEACHAVTCLIFNHPIQCDKDAAPYVVFPPITSIQFLFKDCQQQSKIIEEVSAAPFTQRMS